MIAFATLWLGIVTGSLPVEVLAGPEVARLELHVDGVPCATLAAPPWSATCELGAEIAPHELVATAWNVSGARVGEARQWLNLPRPPAELDVALAEEAGGMVARLAWAAPGGEQPRAVRVWVDGVAVALPADPHVAPLPPAPREQTRLLRVEAEFAGGVLATRELAFGGPYADETAIELTAVPVEEAGRRLRPGDALRSGGRVLPVLALDDGLADLVVVVDPAAVGELVELSRAGSRGRVTKLGPGLSPSAVRSESSDPTLLPEDLRLRLVWPVPQTQGQGLVRFDVFPTSPERQAGDGSLLAQLAQTAALPPPDRPARIADAVALAAVTAAQHGRRRAVLLVLGDGDGDASLYPAAAVRRYLERLRVPLHVWVAGGGDERHAWGEATAVTSVPRLAGANRRLLGMLSRQRIAWVEGRHLPQALEPAPRSGWRLAGVGGGRGDDATTAAPPAAVVAADDEHAGTPQDLPARAAAEPVAGLEQPGEPAGEFRIVSPKPAAAAAPPATAMAGVEVRPFGPFTLATDVRDAALVARLTAVATHLPAGYADRLGLRPAAAGEVLLFAREEDFRRWLAAQEGTADAAVEGFATSGRAGLHADTREAGELTGLVVHELAHLLTRAAVGRPLPPWLEEGLAEELAMSRVDRQGRLLPGTLRSERVVRSGPTGPRGRTGPVERTVRGPAAALVRLVGTRGARVPLAELLAADTARFTAHAGRQERYATAAFFVRFLLAPAGDRHERFRAFLGSVAAGGPADEAAFVAAIGEPLPALEKAFAVWLQRTALAGGE